MIDIGTYRQTTNRPRRLQPIYLFEISWVHLVSGLTSVCDSTNGSCNLTKLAPHSKTWNFYNETAPHLTKWYFEIINCAFFHFPLQVTLIGALSLRIIENNILFKLLENLLIILYVMNQ